MHHLTCGINSLLHPVNLILFTLLLVHLLRISPHKCECFRSHYLLLPRPFTPDLNPICSTNPFLRSLSGSIWSAFTNLGLGQHLFGTGVCLF